MLVIHEHVSNFQPWFNLQHLDSTILIFTYTYLLLFCGVNQKTHNWSCYLHVYRREKSCTNAHVQKSPHPSMLSVDWYLGTLLTLHHVPCSCISLLTAIIAYLLLITRHLEETRRETRVLGLDICTYLVISTFLNFLVTVFQIPKSSLHSTRLEKIFSFSYPSLRWISILQKELKK